MTQQEFKRWLQEHLKKQNKNLWKNVQQEALKLKDKDKKMAAKILTEGLARNISDKHVTKVKLATGITITLEADKKRLQELAGILKPKK